MTNTCDSDDRSLRPAIERRRSIHWVLACGLVAVSGGLWSCSGEPAGPPAAPAGAIQAGQSIGSGTITGRVTFQGTAPARRAIRMSSEAACHKPGSEVLSEDLIVSAGGGVKNAYVHVVSGLGDRVFAPPKDPVVMDQQGCVFEPHVLEAQTGQIVEFTNEDPVVHNVRAITEKNKAFNVSMPGTVKKSVRRFFLQPEVVKIRCDIHAWMSAYIPVEAHPFHAITADDGSFALRGLPAGDYAVEAWHEKLGPLTRTVNVPDGGSATVEFVFGAAP